MGRVILPGPPASLRPDSYPDMDRPQLVLAGEIVLSLDELELDLLDNETPPEGMEVATVGRGCIWPGQDALAPLGLYGDWDPERLKVMALPPELAVELVIESTICMIQWQVARDPRLPTTARARYALNHVMSEGESMRRFAQVLGIRREALSYNRTASRRRRGLPVRSRAALGVRKGDF